MTRKLVLLLKGSILCRASSRYRRQKMLIFLFLNTITWLSICAWSCSSFTLLNFSYYSNSPTNDLLSNNHNSEETLSLTTSSGMIIDKFNSCSANSHLLVLCITAPDHFEARSAIRDTWGSVARKLGAYFYFLIGKTDDQTIQDNIYEEDSIYNDILEADFVDTYYNLTQKSIRMMRWISKWNCSATVRFVFKVDDDMLVNMAAIYNFTKRLNMNRTFIGRLARKWKPFRDPKNVYYVSPHTFPSEYYPNFVTGPAYLFTPDLAKPLYDTASVDDPANVLHFEDVYMSGILGERLGLARLNCKSIVNQARLVKKVNKMNWDTVWTSHMYAPYMLRLMWIMLNGNDS